MNASFLPRARWSLAVGSLALFACSSSTPSATNPGVAEDAGDETSSPTGDAGAIDSGSPSDSATAKDAAPDATADAADAGADLAACKALCAGTQAMACTFARDGVTKATGTYSLRAPTAAGCTGIASVTGDDEQVTLELDCVLGRICVTEGNNKDCFDGAFTSKQFTYEIPADNKRNSCTLP